MSGKTAILGKIRGSLGADRDDETRRRTVAERIASPPVGIIPARGQLPLEDRIALFRAMAEKYNATTDRIDTLDRLPAAVGEFLRAHNLPAVLRMGADPRLAEAPWSSENTLEIRHGASDGLDLVGISHAFGGIAETGTLALLSGADNPVTISFLPEQHIVVVAADAIGGDLETVFARLRAANGKATMPRTLNFITGPSRSADIEQKLLLGAHGPKALHIIVVG
ncbi:LutC/YkgG family protein [Rhizobium halophytocola]|nr:lactate utilization protein [Rhizobium halophytocola]